MVDQSDPQAVQVQGLPRPRPSHRGPSRKESQKAPPPGRAALKIALHAASTFLFITFIFPDRWTTYDTEKAGHPYKWATNHQWTQQKDPSHDSPTPGVPLSSSYATLLGLAIACIAQPSGSLVFGNGGGYLWRLSPISCLIELLVILFLFLRSAIAGYSFRQTSLAILLARERYENQTSRFGSLEDLVKVRKSEAIVLMISVVPAVFAFLRVCGTRGSPATLIIGTIYFLSWLSIAGLIVCRFTLWNSYNLQTLDGAVFLSNTISPLSVSLPWPESFFAFPVFICLYPFFCGWMVVFVLQLFGKRPFWSAECAKELWLPWGVGGVSFLAGLCTHQKFGFLATTIQLLGPAVFVGGSFAFVKLYKQEETYRPPWMEWLGR